MRRTFGVFLAAFALLGASHHVAIHNLSSSDAEKLLDEGGVLLLDVRSEKEYRDGHIPGAILFPITGLSTHLKDLPRDKTQPVLVYCSDGSRSSKAARSLYREGFKDVYNLSGGLHGWVAAQKPLQVNVPGGVQTRP